jgi:hypothetical protein
MLSQTKRVAGFLAVFATVVFGTVTVAVGQQSPLSRQFLPGTVRQIEDLPPGRLRTQIERLPLAARTRAVAWLAGFHFTPLDLSSLEVDSDGGIFYADSFTLAPAAAADNSEPPTAAAAVPVNPFPAGLIFHSRPGAPNVLFLNFSGESVSNTAWNTSLSRTVIPALAFSTDSDYSTFSDAEQTAIKRIWQRVTEDYAPFNVDVTTERPASFNSRTAHALITRNTDANGDANPSSTAGGVAYVSVFGNGNYSNYRPAWIYFNNLANNESYIAEAAAHEAGHNFGLSHDGKTDGTSYYSGHGSGDTSWGPIMGTGYNRNVSQWSKGEYYLANNTQDDLATIAGKLAYRADDHGNTEASATALVITGGTNVVATTPENDPTNANPANKGVLERNTDVDVFSFSTGDGPISLTVNPWIMASGTRGGNLDLVAELYNSAGTLLLTNNSSSLTYARIQSTLTQGTYYLFVRNTGTGNPTNSTPTGYTSYASIGQYFISGYVAPTGSVVPPTALLQVADITQPGVGAKQFTVTYSDNVAVDVVTIDGSDIRITGPRGYDRAGRLISIDASSNGTPRVATYAADPPAGGVWTESDNGTYTILMQTNQVRDTEGASVTAQQLGQFNVSVDSTPPAASLNVANITSGGSSRHSFTVTFTDNSAVSVASLGASDLVVTGPNGYSNVVTFAGVDMSTDGSPRTATYSAPVPGAAWDPSDNGYYFITLRNGEVTDTLNNGTVQTVLGGFTVDIPTVPDATLAATANNPAWGTVAPSGGTFPAGTAVDVTGTPSTYFKFVQWIGDYSATNNPLSVVLNTNVAIQAVFGEIVTTNHATPYWWLASHGYTNDFENAEALTGANGIPLWHSYVAGLDPNDPNSQFLLTVTLTTDGPSHVLNWNTVPGRVYTIWSGTSVVQSFARVAGATNLPWTIQSFTNVNSQTVPPAFYRLEVWKP